MSEIIVLDGGTFFYTESSGDVDAENAEGLFYEDVRHHAPVEYEGALRPQSWAAGAPLLVLRTLLGLDVADGRLRRAPDVPPELGRLRLDAIATSRRAARPAQPRRSAR
jgi:hypothetical protein